MASPGIAPRKAAIYLMNSVIDDGKLLSELLPKAVENLAPEDRARAARLATSTLRWMDRADRMLGPHVQKRPPTFVMNALRLGVVEIYLDGAAAHGVVNSAVEIVRAHRDFMRMGGMVNAVLRKVSDAGPGKWNALVQPQMPKWLRKPLIDDFAKPTLIAIETAHAAGAPLDITVKSDAAGWAQKLGGVALPTGSVRLTGSPQVTALDGFEAGEWWVQDAAAALPAIILAAQTGERVLDVCAAPGGKTMQMAATGADVTALDISKARMARVDENLKRTGLRANLVVGDALTYDDAAYDAILLDAPCSATGTIRRHPDLPYAKDGTDFPTLFALQEAMIDHSWSLLKPGGRMVYSTCSLLIDEGEEQIKDAMARNPDMRVTPDATLVAGVQPDWIGEYGLRTRPDYWPDQGGMDGFFVAVLQKPA
jgi:16S rRNA (cytosine967-C5)-methyltransferase